MSSLWACFKGFVKPVQNPLVWWLHRTGNTLPSRKRARAMRIAWVATFLRDSVCLVSQLHKDLTSNDAFIVSIVRQRMVCCLQQNAERIPAMETHGSRRESPMFSRSSSKSFAANVAKHWRYGLHKADQHGPHSWPHVNRLQAMHVGLPSKATDQAKFAVL